MIVGSPTLSLRISIKKQLASWSLTVFAQFSLLERVVWQGLGNVFCIKCTLYDFRNLVKYICHLAWICRPELVPKMKIYHAAAHMQVSQNENSIMLLHMGKCRASFSCHLSLLSICLSVCLSLLSCVAVSSSSAWLQLCWLQGHLL